MKLLKNPWQREKREEGFTLIELLVVILIIGVLSAIAIPAFMNQKKEASDASLKSDIKSMALAFETWQTKTRDTAGDMVRPTDTRGWTILTRSNPDDFFIGTDVPDSIPENFSKPQLSKGTALGVLTNKVAAKGGFCIVGNNANGNYHGDVLVEEGTSLFENAMYYDSLAGGLHTAQELPSGGACNQYYVRITNGT